MNDEATKFAIESTKTTHSTNVMPDMEYWGRFPAWNVDESAALLLSLDPDDTKRWEMKSYIDLKRLLQRAADVGELEELIKPEHMIEWALANDITVPTYLEEGVDGSSPVQDWRKKALRYYGKLRHLKNLNERSGVTIDNADERSLKSLYRIMYLMLIEKFEFRYDRNNSAIYKIMERFKKYDDVAISEQTVRNHINAARDAVGAEFETGR
jgi:hypothetical protein